MKSWLNSSLQKSIHCALFLRFSLENLPVSSSCWNKDLVMLYPYLVLGSHPQAALMNTWSYSIITIFRLQRDLDIAFLAQHPEFRDEKTETQEDGVTSPKPHS